MVDNIARGSSWVAKHISVNAPSAPDAIEAVRLECRKRGIEATQFTYSRHMEPRMDEMVAIVVTRDSIGPVSRADRVTYTVHFYVRPRTDPEAVCCRN